MNYFLWNARADLGIIGQGRRISNPDRYFTFIDHQELTSHGFKMVPKIFCRNQ